MPMPAGRSVPLSAARCLIIDLMHFSRQVPAVPMERRMDLAPLVAARTAARPRPGWCALFTKAYAVVAARHPELRRAYLPLPRPRLYEHPDNVAAIAIERRYGGERCVLFAHLRNPQQLGLADLEAVLRHCKEFPVPGVDGYRRALQVSAWPRPLRRLAWWAGLNVSGRVRAEYLGTFGVTATAGLGASALFIPSLLTTTLHYGPLDAAGALDVRLAFDHRVLDGGTMARVLKELERVLLGEVLAELRQLQAVRAA